MTKPLLMCLTCLAALGSLQAPPPAPIIGRWDLSIHQPGGDRSAWLEVRHSGTDTLVGQFVGMSGSARPVSRVDFKGGEMRFAIPPQWERVEGEVAVVGRLEGADKMTGSITLGTGATAIPWTAERAPSLRRAAAPVWGTPVALFNGRDLSGWRAIGANEWEAAAGVLRNRKSGGNLVTERTFTDFKLHVEFKYPAGGNSGVYLRGRYEVQIEDSPGAEPANDSLGAVYGFLAPSENAARKPGEWQTYDVTLTGRLITVVLNGRTIICNREIPGITGAALDSREGLPGPLLLQGDHGPVEFRNLTITPAK